MDERQNRRWENAAKDLRVQPSDQVWNRLENRLDQDHGKIKVQVVKKWMGIAATVLILVVAGIFTLISPPKVSDMLVIQELEEPTIKATFAAYRYVSDINGYYQSEGWKQIREGMHKPIVANAKAKELHQAPPTRIQEDTTM